MRKLLIVIAGVMLVSPACAQMWYNQALDQATQKYDCHAAKFDVMATVDIWLHYADEFTIGLYKKTSISRAEWESLQQEYKSKSKEYLAHSECTEDRDYMQRMIGD
jgi:hypothetical protein